MAGFKHTDEAKKKMSEQRVGEKHPNCRLTRDEALICIKMKRLGYSCEQISELFNINKSYVSRLAFLGYKRKDIDYDNLESLLENLNIEDYQKI
jgi:hypothetical protein